MKAESPGNQSGRVSQRRQDEGDKADEGVNSSVDLHKSYSYGFSKKVYFSLQHYYS